MKIAMLPHMLTKSAILMTSLPLQYLLGKGHSTETPTEDLIAQPGPDHSVRCHLWLDNSLFLVVLRLVETDEQHAARLGH
jgi:hypothetical protein